MSNLPPIEHDPEDRLYTKEVSLKRCRHNDIKHENGAIVCSCGASWSGPKLDVLYDLLKNNN